MSLLATATVAASACAPAARVSPSVEAAQSQATAASIGVQSPSPSGPQTPPTMGTPPDDCPGPGPDPQVVADFIGPVAFGPPLWAGFYAEYDAAANAYAAPDAPLTEHGWRIKVLFLLQPGHASRVELVGQGVRKTDGVVLFAIDSTAPSAEAVFDPEAPAIPVQNDGWREYPTYAYFPSPGCYRLSASWQGGETHLGFGIGG